MGSLNKVSYTICVIAARQLNNPTVNRYSDQSKEAYQEHGQKKDEPCSLFPLTESRRRLLERHLVRIARNAVIAAENWMIHHATVRSDIRGSQGCPLIDSCIRIMGQIVRHAQKVSPGLGSPRSPGYVRLVAVLCQQPDAQRGPVTRGAAGPSLVVAVVI